MKRLETSLAILAAALGWWGAAEQAQAQDGDNFDRARNISVRDRPRPEYDARGVPMGGFVLYPELQLAAEYTDNVFGTDTNTEEDLIWHVDPSLELKSRWSTHELNFSLAAPMRYYNDFDEADTTDLIGAVDGRLDIYRDFYIHGSVGYGDRSEPLSSSPTNLPLAEPIEYTTTNGTLGVVRAFNRLRISGEASYASYDYEDGLLFNLTPVDQDDRDRDILEGGVRFDYAVSPGTALFLAVGANGRDYDLDPPAVLVNRDSEGYEALVGANFDISHLIRGEIGVGYLSQSYDESGIGESSGLAVRTNIQWFPDELVTVSFGASREVGDAGAFGAASYIANNASFAVDYEWRRNVIFGLTTGFSFDDYNGIEREDTRWSAELSADYLMNRGAAVFFQAGHYEQQSDGLQQGRDYDINRAVIGIKLRR